MAQARRKSVESATIAKAESTARPLESVAGNAASTVPDFDAVIHERGRLAIMTALASGEARSHIELRELLQLTDGNLSVHARKLEDAGYVLCVKEFAGRTPRTSYRVTASGRRAFDRYLAHLEALVLAVKSR